MAASKYPARSDNDFIELDSAIGTLHSWWREIRAAAATVHISESTLEQLMGVLSDIHNGDFNHEERVKT